MSSRGTEHLPGETVRSDVTGPKSSPPVRSARITSRDAVEIYLEIRPRQPAPPDFTRQAMGLYDKLRRAVRAQGIEAKDIVTEKIFLSDIKTQGKVVENLQREFHRDSGSGSGLLPATTLVQQPPAEPGSLCELQAFAFLPQDSVPGIQPVQTCLPPGASIRVVRAGGLNHVFLAGITGGYSGDGLDFPLQATSMFQRGECCLRQEGLSFHNVVRTWIYLSRIQHHYDALNRVRNDFFCTRNIEQFPASTGIEGIPDPPDRGCGLDLRAIGGKGPYEVRTIHSPTMNEAYDYGSAFSRGTRVTLPDRCVVHVSGTASIDEQGRVAHVGDIEGQATLMLRNIERLLQGQGATPRNIVSATTYLKRGEDHRSFLRVYEKRGFPSEVPHTVCVAAVCRPDWLCEMEVIAILT